jgi:parallel beta-helix repeat protein
MYTIEGRRVSYKRKASLMLLLAFLVTASVIITVPNMKAQITLCWTMTDEGWWSGAAYMMNTLLTSTAYIDSADPWLELVTKYRIEDFWDFGFVQVSTDGGLTWVSLENEYTKYAPDAHPDIVANLPGLTGASDDWPEWMTMSFNLTSYAGETVMIGFRYMTDQSVLYEGWYISEALVSGVPITFMDGVWVDDDFDSSTPDWGITHFDKIQDGVDAVMKHGTVHVKAGTYYEHVTINKSLTLLGEDRRKTIIDGGGTGTAVHIARNGTGIANFTIQNANIGVYFDRSYWVCTENYLSNNNVGIYLFHKNRIMIFHNDFSNNNVGIELYQSKLNQILRNNFIDNNVGMKFNASSENSVLRNNILSNNVGMEFNSSENNVSWRNNFIDNTHHVSTDDSRNAWSYNTPYFAFQGNYWSGYSGVDNLGGAFQNETGSDGVGDTPYNVTSNTLANNTDYPPYPTRMNNIDYYPYMEPWHDPGWHTEMGLHWTSPLGLEDRFIVTGLVENPLNLTYRELLSFPLWSETATLICDPVDQHLFITCDWIGVPLSYLLNLAKVNENATEVVFYGDDHFYSSLDIETAMEPHVLLALKVNGTLLSETLLTKIREDWLYQPLSWLQRFHSGFRLVVPCRYGYKWVKNIVRIQVVDYDSKGFGLEGPPGNFDQYNEGKIPNCTLPLRVRVPNGDFDLLVGSSNNTVMGYKNIGSPVEPEWTKETEWNIPDILGDKDRASPTFGDLDNDGDYDLLISNARDNYPPMGYKNVGDMSHPVWERCAEWDVPNLHSYEQNPELVDLDNDGDYDLLIGCIPGAAGEGVIYTFENNGTAESPRWNRKPEWDLSCLPWSCPSAADLDHDGDFDLMVGQYYDGNIVAYGYENNGTASNPSWRRKPEWDAPINPNVTKKHKRPALIDIDNDGDYDLFVGAGTDILAYENSGNSTSPLWSRKPEWDFLSVTPTKPAGDWTRPVFVDLDADIHDIMVVSLESSKTVVGQGYFVSISATIVNHGNHAETFNVTVYVDLTLPIGDEIIVGEQTVTNLVAGEVRPLTYVWNTTGINRGSYTISAVADTLLGETHTADNTFTDGTVKVTIPGDINGDGTVDGMDLGELGMSWLASVGDPDYVANRDINGDGTVDGMDLGIMGMHWLETDP